MHRLRSAEAILRALKDKKDLKKRLGEKIIFVVGGKPGECIAQWPSKDSNSCCREYLLF